MHPSPPRKKVLVVDEDTEMRIFLGHLLELGGIQAVTAASATEGFQKLDQERPDLILLSAMFNDHGELKMLKQLKQNESFQEIPVVLISSIEQRLFYQLRILPQIPGQGFAWQPDGFLSRPPEAEELLGLVNRLSLKQGY